MPRWNFADKEVTDDFPHGVSMKQRKPAGNKRSSAKRASGNAAGTARQPYGRDDWIAAARNELIAAGVDAVKVGRLARRLHVTRGGFYWHFTSRADLLR